MEIVQQYLRTIEIFEEWSTNMGRYDWQLLLGIADYYTEIEILREMLMELGRS